MDSSIDRKLKKAFLIQRQNLPLEAKIKLSQRRILDFYNHYDGNVYVAFSGGKDSTVLKHLVETTLGCHDVPSVFIDTALEYPEAREFVQSFGNVEIIKPTMRFEDVLKKYGYPVISKEIAKFISEYRTKPDGYTAKKFDPNSDYVKKYGSRYCLSKWVFMRDSHFKISSRCCDVMKKKPSKQYEKSTGRKPYIATMASESNIRKTIYLRHGCNSFNSKRPISTPLGFWREQDIFEYILKFNLPYCKAYGEIKQDSKGRYFTTGLERTGCIFCMFGVHSEKSPNRFEKMRETHPRLHNYCMNKLGCAAVLDYMGVKY